MSSTTVRSKSTASIAGSVFNPTKETLKFPPKTQVFNVIPSYVKEQENGPVRTFDKKDKSGY